MHPANASLCKIMSYFLCPHSFFFSRSSIRFEPPKCLFLCPLHHCEFGSITPTQKLDWWHKIGILRVADQQARTGQRRSAAALFHPAEQTSVQHFYMTGDTRNPVCCFALATQCKNVVFIYLLCGFFSPNNCSVCKPGLIYNYAFFW